MRGIRDESWGKFISSWEATDPSTATKWLLHEKTAVLHTPEGGPGRIFWFRVLSWVWVWSRIYGPPSVSYFFPTSIHANPHSQLLGLGLTQICWLLPSCLQSFLINHSRSQLNKYPCLSVPVLVYGLPSCQEKPAYPRHNDHWGSNVLPSWWPSRIVMLLQTWVVLVLFPPWNGGYPCLPQRCDRNNSNSHMGVYFLGPFRLWIRQGTERTIKLQNMRRVWWRWTLQSMGTVLRNYKGEWSA